jgi:hypothetical protein
MENARSSRLQPLVLAECIENKGRFLPAISTALQGYVDEPTWTLAAHDAKLDSFHKSNYTVDLRAASFGHDIGAALYLIGDKLDPALRQRVVSALYERCLKPVRNSLVTGKGHFWLNADHNWNSVCLAGVVGIALAVEPDRRERAVFVVAGEHYSKHFLKGFRDDGYCDEGGGYWSYGFGNYAILREELFHATGGKVDLFTDEKVVNIALFGARFQLNDHIMPPFSDCHKGTRADMGLLAYCNDVLDLHMTGLDAARRFGLGNLGTTLIEPKQRIATNGSLLASVGARSYFSDAGVLVCRPSETGCQMAVAIKSGGNGNHSHNDIGSYIIQLGEKMEIGEPGGPFVYSRDTFGSKRYQSKLINSYGHPVPVVAGKLQISATKAKPVVLHTQFSVDFDEIQIDMKPAYNLPELIRLVRTLRYDRHGTGAVIITDEVEFSKPSTFETVLTSRAAYTQNTTKELEFSEDSRKLTASIKTDEDVVLSDEVISEMSTPPYKRIGLKLAKPVTKATVQITFK